MMIITFYRHTTFWRTTTYHTLTPSIEGTFSFHHITTQQTQNQILRIHRSSTSKIPIQIAHPNSMLCFSSQIPSKCLPANKRLFLQSLFAANNTNQCARSIYVSSVAGNVSMSSSLYINKWHVFLN